MLVARMVDDSYNNLDTDSLQRIFYKQQFNYDTIINDVQTVDTTLKALGNLLFESGRYDIVIPENRFLPFEKNAFITKELTWEEVKSLCDTFNTDAVLSIDHFKTRVITAYDKNDYFSQSENLFYERAEAEIKISFEVVIRVYDPAREKIESRFILRDTLVWDDSGTTVGELFARFTPIKDALSEVGIAVALEFANQVNPKWKLEKRGYFIKGDANLKQAAPLVSSSQWGTAIMLWKETVQNAKSKSLKSKAEFNIALGYEMLGDIDESIKWALQSYETMFRTNTYNYLETLKRRKTELNNQ
ncbi:hypothetical protein MASR2M47_19500 [Draconibacterium sp.]